MRNPNRRTIAFDRVDQIMPEIERLSAGHTLLGHWTLGQICRHLEASFDGSVRGFDLRNHRIKRFFLAKRMLKYALQKGIPEGYTVDPRIEPKGVADEGIAVNALGNSIRAYHDFRGELHPHPLFGNLSKDTWDRVHCIHCAHHLSFVLPTCGSECTG